MSTTTPSPSTPWAPLRADRVAALLADCDARLQLPWDRAVLDVGGVPTGAPEVQLLWKCFSVRPEDDVDKDAVLPLLSADARAWWEKALLRIHPHSSWTIPVRSPMFPARASWNRPQR